MTLPAFIITLCSALAVATAVCHGIHGCFDNAPPFDNANKLVPESPDKVGTKFLLYTQSTKNGPALELSYADVAVIRRSGFDAALPVKIIVHGFSSNENAKWMQSMKDAFLATSKFNVILTGWAKGAAAPTYYQAAANARLVGKQTAMLVQLLVQCGSSLQKVHIIGHSLGAHIAGYAGSELRGGVKRISGLDPAGPAFDGKDVKVRLDQSDAAFVDVIHTNGAPLLKGGAGTAAKSGHVDFYPNGGISQPGCPPLVQGTAEAILRGDFKAVTSVASCSHGRAHDLYIESITSKQCNFRAYGCPGGYADFQAGKCSSCPAGGCSEMGYNADKFAARGSMFLRTGGAAPFCSTQPAVGYF